MPTGGGKSLCYQLPALVSGQTAIVVSPLIALMQDQAAQLSQIGIPAAVLNSAIPWSEQSNVVSQAARGAYRLLYLSPERLAKPETVAWLSRVPIGYFAIDEAHCISEWGHEFRPEYRQLSSLRANFPDQPIAAFTASATHRVRHDILAQLQLRDPHKYIQSFHRSNLRYLVRQCENDHAQRRLLVAALRAHAGDNVIVYAPTIARVEETVDFLAEKGIAAVPYHAKMDTRTRQRNQERWMSDEVRVLVGTIAFGLGINKAAVRAVIHLSLPKSLEQYYQEAGRAGPRRPCRRTAHCSGRRRTRVCSRTSSSRSPIVTNRSAPGSVITSSAASRIPRLAGTGRFACTSAKSPSGIAARCAMFVARRRNGWKVNPKPRHSRWSGGPDPSERSPGWRRKPSRSKQRSIRSCSNTCASGAAAYRYATTCPRSWCCMTARSRICAASSLALTPICWPSPASARGKPSALGAAILETLEAFRNGARAARREQTKVSPADETIRLLAEGRSFEEIAQIRERRVATVIDLVAELVERGRIEFDHRWMAPDRRGQIEAAIERLGTARMKTIKDALPPDISYGEIRLVAALRQRSSRLDR